MPAIALTSPSIITAIGNDYGFADVFARQVRAHGKPGDMLVAMSTSGQSPNVIAAVREAQRIGMFVLILTGPSPDVGMFIDADKTMAIKCEGNTPAIQQTHLEILHKMCAEFEELRP
jgi:D-sedoheptulose 7-phosphate isomerase